MALLFPDEQAIAVATLRGAWSDIGLPEKEADEALSALCAELRAVVGTAVEREKGRKASLEADERSLRSELSSLAAALGEEAALSASAGQPPLLAWRAVAAEAERLRAARSERLAAREAAAGKLHTILVELSGGTPEEAATRGSPADANEPAPDAPGGLTTALVERLQTRLVRALSSIPAPPSLCLLCLPTAAPHSSPLLPALARFVRVSLLPPPPPHHRTHHRQATAEAERAARLDRIGALRSALEEIVELLGMREAETSEPAAAEYATSAGATRKALEAIEARLDHLREEKGRR